MGIARIGIVLTIVNLMLLVVLLAHLSPVQAQEPAPILRGRGLQIVDDAGRIRASLAVLPAEGQSPETVLLRLITEQGRPSVKIGASEESAGVTVVGPTGTNNTWVTVKADGLNGSVLLKSESGGEQLLQP